MQQQVSITRIYKTLYATNQSKVPRGRLPVILMHMHKNKHTILMASSYAYFDGVANFSMFAKLNIAH